MEAAQKFLRGIRSLTSYEEVKDKQALWVCRKHWTKCSASRQLKRLRGWPQVQPDFWGDSQAESFRENVAVKRGLWKAIRLVAWTLREPGMRRGKGCRPQGLEMPENLVALQAVGRYTSGCASTSNNTTWFLFDSGFLRGSDECLA